MAMVCPASRRTAFTKSAGLCGVRNFDLVRRIARRWYAASGLLAVCAPIMHPSHAQLESGGPEAVELTVELHDITLADQLSWSVLKIIAPERLREIVPVYIYQADDLRNSTSEALTSCLDLVRDQPDYGIICAYGRSNGDGSENTLGSLEFTTAETFVFNDGEAATPTNIALNHRFPDIPPDDVLWMSRHSWSDAVRDSATYQNDN